LLIITISPRRVDGEHAGAHYTTNEFPS
jgi:hypothetical protein